MGLKESFGLVKDSVNILSIAGDGVFPGNEQGTCTGQVLTWFRSLNGSIKTGQGLKEALLSPQEVATVLHFSQLENGLTSKLREIADKTIDLRGLNSAKLIEQNTPWAGKFKLYIIASSNGNGHALGAYFPWFGKVQFYDPNLIICEIKNNNDIFSVLSKWAKFYDNLDGPGSLWGYENLYVVPESALESNFEI